MLHSFAAEEWRPVVGYEGWYEVSNLGRVRRIAPADCSWPGRILKPRPHRQGYMKIALYRGGKQTRRDYFIHCLVAEAFIGPCEDGREVNHKDLNKAHNTVTNLEYATRLENQRHAIANGCRSYARGSAHVSAKLNEEAVAAILRRRRSGETQRSLACEYGVSESALSAIIHGKVWAHLQQGNGA